MELVGKLRTVACGRMQWQLFDLISGLSGVGIVIINSPPRSSVVLQEIVDTLNGLLQVNRVDPEAMFTPNDLIDSESLKKDYPAGMYNLGLAHGISGPLAFLAIAYMDECVVSLPSALEPICDWFISRARFDSFGPYIPPGEGPSQTIRSPRATWCYGTPGIARSLWLAGKAAGRLDVQAFAESVVEATLKRRLIEPSAMMCHGTAGLLQILKRFAHDDKDSPLQRYIQELTVLQTERAAALLQKDLPISDLGLLEGLSGVGCCLLNLRESPSWDRIFAIA